MKLSEVQKFETTSYDSNLGEIIDVVGDRQLAPSLFQERVHRDVPIDQDIRQANFDLLGMHLAGSYPVRQTPYIETQELVSVYIKKLLDSFISEVDLKNNEISKEKGGLIQSLIGPSITLSTTAF